MFKRNEEKKKDNVRVQIFINNVSYHVNMYLGNYRKQLTKTGGWTAHSNVNITRISVKPSQHHLKHNSIILSHFEKSLPFKLFVYSATVIRRKMHGC